MTNSHQQQLHQWLTIANKKIVFFILIAFFMGLAQSMVAKQPNFLGYTINLGYSIAYKEKPLSYFFAASHLFHMTYGLNDWLGIGGVVGVGSSIGVSVNAAESTLQFYDKNYWRASTEHYSFGFRFGPYVRFNLWGEYQDGGLDFAGLFMIDVYRNGANLWSWNVNINQVSLIGFLGFALMTDIFINKRIGGFNFGLIFKDLLYTASFETTVGNKDKFEINKTIPTFGISLGWTFFTPIAKDKTIRTAARVSIPESKGADDKNVGDYDGEATLHWAAKKGRTRTAKLRIEAGADINAKDKYGETPLHLAADFGKMKVAQLLIKAGADVNAKNNSGLTPLHWAANSGYTNIMQLLIAAGADINAKDDDGATPLHWATAFGNTFEHIIMAVRSGTRSRLNRLRRIETVRLLIAAGADINAKYNDGKTPLHWAAAKTRTKKLERETIVKLLVKAGANINAEELERKAIVKLLVKAGANINAKDDDGKTPLAMAIEEGQTRIAKYLRSKGAK